MYCQRQCCYSLFFFGAWDFPAIFTTHPALFTKPRDCGSLNHDDNGPTWPNSCQGMLISSIVWAYIIGAACAVMSKMARAFGGKLPSMSNVGTMGMVLLAFPEFSIFRDRVLIYVLMRWWAYVWLIDFSFPWHVWCAEDPELSEFERRSGGWFVGWIYSCPSMPWYNMIQLKMMDYLQVHDDTSYYMFVIQKMDTTLYMNIYTVPLTLALCCILLSHIISKLRGFCNGHLCQRIDDFNSMAQDQETSNAKTETETERWNLF